VRPAGAANPLRPWVRALLRAAAWSLLLSGLLWLPVHYLYGAGAGELPAPLEPWLLRWHGLAVLGLLWALGAVSAAHVPRGWGMRRQRRSGATLLAGWALLAASGFALSYLVPEPWRPGLGLAHAAAGPAVFLLGAVHGRRRPRP
jgi:hypothetical protein